MSISDEILKKCSRFEILQLIEIFNKDEIEKMVYVHKLQIVNKISVLRTWTKLKNIMNKIKKKGTYILKTNEKPTLNFV